MNQYFLLYGIQGLWTSNTHQPAYNVASTDWKSLRFCWMLTDCCVDVDNTLPICSWFHIDKCSLLIDWDEVAGKRDNFSSQQLCSLGLGWSFYTVISVSIEQKHIIVYLSVSMTYLNMFSIISSTTPFTGSTGRDIYLRYSWRYSEVTCMTHPL